MRFVVSTHSYLLIVEFDNSWKVEDMTVLAEGHHYGVAISRDDGSEFIAKGGKGEILTTYRREAASDAAYVPSTVVDLGSECQYIHQIVACEEGLYVANTGFNSLVLVSLAGDIIDRFDFASISRGAGHVNSVFPVGPNRVVALLHNKQKHDSEAVVLKRSSAHGLTPVTLLRLWDRGAHNLYFDERYVVYNASSVGHFVLVDLGRQRVHKRFRFPGHTKGLSITDDLYIVGVSDHADREARRRSNAHLAVIDREDQNLVTMVQLPRDGLPHPVGNINEIRCLNAVELGHSPASGLEIDWENLSLAASDLWHRIGGGLTRRLIAKVRGRLSSHSRPRQTATD